MDWRKGIFLREISRGSCGISALRFLGRAISHSQSCSRARKSLIGSLTYRLLRLIRRAGKVLLAVVSASRGRATGGCDYG